jgi:biopolymer transport protein ExbD
MKVKLVEAENTEVQMGPLIDCVFLMLIFFIVIAVTKKSVKELGIQLPAPGAAVTDVKPRDRDLVIRVTRDGVIYVGSTEVQRQGLLDAIREARSVSPDTKVRFELDERAQVRHLMPIWDHLTHYGLTRWGIRTTMEE